MYHYRISYLNLTLVWFCCIDITRLDIIKNLSILLSKTLHIFKNKKESKNRKINVQFLFVNWNLINQYEEDCLKSFGWHLKYFVHFCKNFPKYQAALLYQAWPDLLTGGSLAVCSQLINYWMLLWSKCFISDCHLQFLLFSLSHLASHTRLGTQTSETGEEEEEDNTTNTIRHFLSV